jgi:hypothetical protein
LCVACGAWIVFKVSIRSIEHPSGAVPEGGVRSEATRAAQSNVLDQTADDTSAHRTDVAFRRCVVSSDQDPLVGAEISCTPLPAPGAAIGGEPGPRDNDAWYVVSDSTGAFDLDQRALATRPADCVIWVTAPGYLSRSFVLSVPFRLETIPSPIVLDFARGVDVDVVDVERHRVAGARVQLAADIDTGDPDPSLDLRVQSTLRRIVETDSSGRAHLPAVAGRLEIRARHSDLESEPWRGSCPASITLELAPVFTVSGAVLPEAPFQIDANTRVICSLSRGDRTVVLERCHVDASGRWGIARLPVRPADSYVFALEGSGLVSEQHSLVHPRAGRDEHIDFHPRRAATFSVHTVDDKGAGLADSIVSVQWNANGAWNKIERHTHADGIARFEGCAPGGVWVRARHSGFVPQLVDPNQANTSRTDPLLVQFARGGRIEGRCVHAGSPVREFTLFVWQGNVSSRLKLAVEGSPDGKFTVDEVPLGEVIVLATSDEWPSSEPTHLTVVAGETAHAELELPDALKVSGQVVSASSAEPLPEATVQLHSMFQDLMMRPLGMAHPVDSRGTFDVSGLHAGNNLIQVSAPGYASRNLFVIGHANQAANLGTIGLFSKQSCEVRLVSDTAEDFTKYIAELNGAVYVGDQSFPANGVLRYDGLDPSGYYVRVVFPDWSQLIRQFDLNPGHDVKLEIPLRGRSLDVEVAASAGTSLPADGFLIASFTDRAERRDEQAYVLPADGHVHITRLEGDSVMLEVQDAHRAALALRWVSLEPKTLAPVQIQLTSDVQQFRVVDSQREPLAGARLTFSDAHGHSGWVRDLETDSRGLCSVSCLSSSELFVNVFHFSIGLRPSELVQISASPRATVEFVLAPNLSLVVRLLERNHPGAYVEAWAKDSRGLSYGLGTRFSDADGIVKWGPVSPGDYRVSIAQPGYWQTEQAVHLGNASDPITIQVRRLGSLQTSIVDRYGAAAPGVELELQSIEESASVADWIHSGAVPSPPNGLVSDAQGHLRVDAIPNGDYRWSVKRTDGSPLTGVVNVPPNGVAALDVTVQ